MKKDSSKNIYPSIIKDPLLCCSFAERKESFLKVKITLHHISKICIKSKLSGDDFKF